MASTRPEVGHPRGEVLETEFGGVFYLINLALFLNLYGDFTCPLRPGLAMPLWDFIALVGRELVGERLCADPIWGLLARLSGRKADAEPGDGFAAPVDWVAPGDWEQFLQTMPDEVVPEMTRPVSRPVTVWLKHLMPFLRWRLSRALGLDDPAQIPTVLCEHSARIQVSEARVDVTFVLDRLPIAVRLSGLDRDPGWVPAAGRFIAFHYE